MAWRPEKLTAETEAGMWAVAIGFQSGGRDFIYVSKNPGFRSMNENFRSAEH